MHHRVLAPVSAAAVVVTFVVLAAASAAAQTESRTGWGDPDLQGIWDFRTITPLERPEDLGDRAFLTAEEAANLEQEVVDRNSELASRAARRTTATESVDRGEEGAPGFYNNFWLDRGTRTVGTRRTSLVVDPPNGRLPELSPEGRERTAARRAYLQEHPADSWLDRSAFDRCILGFNAGPPITPGGYNQNLQVFQTPDHVVLVTEMVHTVRVVPLDGRPVLPGHVRQWSGDSRGHWEGDTLVIETANFNDQRRWRGTTRNMTLVERLTRVDADTLEYEYTVTDPQTWTRPWTASIPMQRERPAALRVRLPRGELQHARDPGRASGRGSRGCGGRRAAQRLGAAVSRTPGDRQPLRRRHLRPGRVPRHLGRGALPDQHRA